MRFQTVNGHNYIVDTQNKIIIDERDGSSARYIGVPKILQGLRAEFALENGRFFVTASPVAYSEKYNERLQADRYIANQELMYQKPYQFCTENGHTFVVNPIEKTLLDKRNDISVNYQEAYIYEGRQAKVILASGDIFMTSSPVKKVELMPDKREEHTRAGYMFRTQNGHVFSIDIHDKTLTDERDGTSARYVGSPLLIIGEPAYIQLENGHIFKTASPIEECAYQLQEFDMSDDLDR